MMGFCQLVHQKRGAPATARRLTCDRRGLRTGMCGAILVLCFAAADVSSAQDTPATIISDHIRRQGFSCEEPRQAQRDVQASRPNGAVWVMTCKNATYRVTLIPDMAAHVEPIK
jgi:hypothetical protein